MSNHDAKQDAEWTQILLIFASSTRPHLDQGEAPKRGIFNQEYKKIKECPRKLTRVQKRGDISAFFGRKVIINEVNCTCFWCPPNPAPKILISPICLPRSLPSSLANPRSLPILPHNGKVVNPYAKIKKPTIAEMPPRRQHPSSPSKFRPLLQSSKRPIIAPHPHQAQHQSIPVPIAENPPKSPSSHSKNQPTSESSSSKQISEDQQLDGKPTASSTVPPDLSEKPTDPLQLSLSLSGINCEHKSKVCRHISFLLPKVPLPRTDIHELFESTSTVRSKGFFELTPFCWMGGKCPRCKGDIAYHTRD